MESFNMLAILSFLAGMIKNLQDVISPPPKSGLYEVVWNLTEACNLKCQYCYSSSGSGKWRSFSLPDAKKAIAQMEELDVRMIAFSGGDPLLNPDFFEIATICREKFKVLFLSTNGLNITEDSARKIRDVGIDSVQVSIDWSEKVHDFLRGMKGAFWRALNGIRLLKKYGMDIAIAPTINRFNIWEVEYLHSLGEKLGCDISFKRTILTWRGDGRGQFVITPSQYRKLYEFAHEKNSRSSVYSYLHCDPLRFLLAMDEETKDRYSKSPNIVGGCMAGIGVAYLNVDGSVFPCSKLPFSLGNIHTEKFSDIWNDSPFLHQLRNRKNLLGKCGKCKYVNMCGGCRASGFEQRGKLFDEDYMCWL